MVSERLVKEKLKNSPKPLTSCWGARGMRRGRARQPRTQWASIDLTTLADYGVFQIIFLIRFIFYISINCSLLTHWCLCNPAHIDDISISYILGFPYIVNNNEQTLLVKIPLLNSSISNTSFWWIITLVDGGEEYDGPADVEQDHAERHARGHQEKVLGNTAN